MRRDVYLGGQGVACAAGIGRAASASAIRSGGYAHARRALAAGERAYAAIPGLEGSWNLRLSEGLRRTVSAALDEAGLEAGAAAGLPLFIGSSSLHVGLGESEGAAQTVPRLTHLSGLIREALGWRGPIAFSTTACTSALVALKHASDAVASGRCEAALAIGIELENRTSLNGFSAMGLLSPTVARPFCAGRDGLLLGEALAAAVVSPRPARWRLAALELGLDPHSPTGVDPSGRPQADLLRRVLRGAGWSPEQVDLIKAHAAGSPSNDAAEALALRAVFDTPPPLLSLKSIIGHTLGASGLAELAALSACLEAGFLPPTPGFERPDPELGLAPVAGGPAGERRRLLLNWIGFGGSLAALALEDRSSCSR